MTGKSRHERLGWTGVLYSSLRSEELIAAMIECTRKPRPEWAYKNIFSMLSSDCCFRYISGADDEARKLALRAVAAAKEYFFGHWRSEVPAEDGSKRPNPAWWQEGDFFNLELCTDAMMLGSVVGDWPFVHKMAKHILGIPWQNIRDGREENSVRMVVAATALGIRPDAPEVAGFVKTVETGKRRFEKLQLAFVTAIQLADDAGLQSAAEAYYQYFCKVVTKRADPVTTNFIMIDGTLYTNLALHAGRKLVVPDWVGERYVSVLRRV
jgi:hypothetical protein